VSASPVTFESGNSPVAVVFEKLSLVAGASSPRSTSISVEVLTSSLCGWQPTETANKQAAANKRNVVRIVVRSLSNKEIRSRDTLHDKGVNARFNRSVSSGPPADQKTPATRRPNRQLPHLSPDPQG